MPLHPAREVLLVKIADHVVGAASAVVAPRLVLVLLREGKPGGPVAGLEDRLDPLRAQVPIARQRYPPVHRAPAVRRELLLELTVREIPLLGLTVLEHGLVVVLSEHMMPPGARLPGKDGVGAVWAGK